ncbi:MAG: NAD(+) synthase, partial [Anaerolineales bacterium]
VVAGLSGGVDSALATSIAARALGPSHVHPLLMPFQEWHTAASERAWELTRALAIPTENVKVIDITPMVHAFVDALGLGTPPPSGPGAAAVALRTGNIMARVRMIALFDHARREGALVLGTENRTEHYLGYYTRFGDEASDLEPLRGLWKGEVQLLARLAGVPDSILDTAPTAGLWEGQTDEGEFGFTYEQADAILHAQIDRGWGEAELAATGVPLEVAQRVAKWVESMAYKTRLPVLGPEPVIRTGRKP